MASRTSRYDSGGGRSASRYASSSSNSSYDVRKQVKNYRTRLGSKADDATDKRNPLEKLLGLKKDQNVLFDVFELLGRPQQALFNAIDAGQKGEDIGSAAWKGFKGDKEVSGKDLLKNAGMSDREGKLDASDVLGFGLDVFADPMDIPLIPVKTAATGVKAARLAGDLKTIDKISDTVRGVKTAANTADTLKKGLKLADTAEQITQAARTGTHLMSPSEGVFKLAGKGIKKGAKIADTGIEKVLGKMDANATNKIKKLVDSGVDLETAKRAIGKSTDKLQTYRDIKKGVQRIFDSSKNVKGLIGKGREAENIKSVERYFGEKSLEDIRNTAEAIAKKQGGNYDDVYANIMSRLSDAVESNADWSLKGSDVINKFKASKTADFFSDDQAKGVQKVLDNFGIKTTLEDGGKLTLNSQNDVKKLYSISDAVLDESTGTKFADNVFGQKMTQETADELKAAREYFKADPELKSLYDKVNNATYNQAKISGEIKGLNPQNITTEGYVRHNLNENLSRSQVKAFDARKYDAPIRQVNKMKRAEIDAQIKGTKEGIKKIQSQIYKTDDAGNFILDASGKKIRDDKVYNNLVSNKESLINTLQKQLSSYQEIIKKQAGLDINPALLSKKGEKAIETIDSVKGLKNDLDNIAKEIKNINFKNINPENAQAIKNVLDDYKAYTKKITGLKNYATKNNVDEVGGLFTRKEQVKGVFENVQNAKKRLTASMREARGMADKTNRDLIKKANKGAKESFAQGKEYAKLDARFKDTEEKVRQIYQNANDMVDSLTKRINYEKASLEKLKGAGADTIFNQKLDRISKMSESINTLSSEAGEEFFKTAFDMNFADYIKRNADFTTGAKKFNDALVSGIFADTDFVKTIENLVDEKQLKKLMEDGLSKEQAIRKLNPKIPYGFQKVNGSYLAKKLSKYEGILSEGGKSFIKDVEKFIGKDIYMDKELVNMLDVGTKVISNEVNPLLKVWDGLGNMFKKFSTLSPGFQMRNIIGNSTDMVLSGMPATSLPSYYKRASSLLNEYYDLARKFTEGTLNASEKVKWNDLLDFHKAGFDDAYAKVQNLDTLKLQNKKNPINWVSQQSMDMNEKMDRWNRMTLFLYAKDNPNYMSKLGAKNATDAVRKVLFDPSNMSEFESKFAKRVIPFYTFTKQNLMLQMDNMMRNTPRYNRLFKSLNSLYDNLDENQYFQYQKEGMQIPLPFKDDKGNQMFLKSNLPVSDLGEWLSSPAQRLLASTAPGIKTPIEMVTGKDLFTGDDSYKNTFSGLAQATTGSELQGIGAKWATKAEQLLSGLGLGNITTNNIKKVSAVLKKHNGDMDNQAMWAEIFRSVLQNTNQEKVEMSKAYEDLEAYQGYVKQLKNQGINVPTIRELNQQSKRTLRNVKNKRKSRYGN